MTDEPTVGDIFSEEDLAVDEPGAQAAPSEPEDESAGFDLTESAEEKARAEERKKATARKAAQRARDAKKADGRIAVSRSLTEDEWRRMPREDAPRFVQVYTRTCSFGFEPDYPGEVTRAAGIVALDYPRDEFPKSVIIDRLTNTRGGDVIVFPGGETIRDAMDAASAAARARAAERHTDEPSLTDAELAHRDKVLALPYTPSAGFGPDGMPL